MYQEGKVTNRAKAGSGAVWGGVGRCGAGQSPYDHDGGQAANGKLSGRVGVWVNEWVEESVASRGWVEWQQHGMDAFA